MSYSIFILSLLILHVNGTRTYGRPGFVGNDLSISETLRQSLAEGWYSDIRFLSDEETTLESNEDDEKAEKRNGGTTDPGTNPGTSQETFGEAQIRYTEWHAAQNPQKLFDQWVPSDPAWTDKVGKVKAVADEVNSVILDPDRSKVPQFANPSDANIQKLSADTVALRAEIDTWDKTFGTDTKAYWGGIGTDTLYLSDRDVMKTTTNEKTKKTTNHGKYFEDLKELDREVKRRFRRDKPTKDKLPGRKASLEAKLKKVRETLGEIYDPIKTEGSTFKVDFTAKNSRIPDDVTLRDQFRVLQGFNNIARERLWGKTEFDINFGGRDVKFTLDKASWGYSQLFYENPVKDEKYGKRGTAYDKDIFPQLESIKGSDNVETRKKQVKIAEFMTENLDKPIGDQPKYTDLVNDPDVPLPEMDNIHNKRVVEDLVILGSAVEAAAMPQKQLDHWVEKIKADSGIQMDTSGDIEELNVPGASREDYKSSGRTMALDTVFYDQLQRFKSGDLSHKTTLNEVFSVNEFPARMNQGTSESKKWAAKPKTQERALLSSLEFYPISSTLAPDPPSSPDTKTATGSIAQGLLNRDDIGRPLGATAMQMDVTTTRGVKRQLVNADDESTRAKIKKTSDVKAPGGASCSKRQGVCSFKDKNIVLDEDSVRLEDDILTYHLYDTHNKDTRYTATTKLDPEELSSVKYGHEQDEFARDSGGSGIHSAVGTAFGVHGTIMSAFGAISAFERGDTTQGVISTVQTAHSLGSLTRLNEIIEKVGEKAILKAVAKGAAKVGLTKLAEKASSKLLRMAERDTERLLGDIPYVGLAFDAYFIAEDIVDLTKAIKSKDTEEIALDTVHLILDIGTTIASFIVDALGPEFEPIVWALSLIRMSIDDFYYDISAELKKAHGTGEKILAFFKGLGEGFVDFLTGGLLRSLQQLSEQQKKDSELLAKFGNPRLYFNLSSDCKIIDFTNGSFSAYGGGLNFKLNDDDSFTVTISDAPDEGGVYSTKTQRFNCSGLTDIILGIGESQTIDWKTQEAKLWAVIPVASAQVINNYTDDQNSLYGSYTGNKENNTFIAFQGNFSKVLPNECQDPEATGIVDFRLKNYFYILNGMAGNDTFFLGPQKSHVTGGSGHDLYYLGTHGGKTVIDNFAFDKLSDTLWLNVSHGHVICGRKNYDLLVQYCGTHMVLVQNWFYPVSNGYRRHLVLLTRDGVQLKVNDLGFLNNQYTVDCLPVSIDLSRSGKKQYLNLTKSPYQEVVTVTGSTKDDTIIGNDESNFINAGPGSNIIRGGEGEDTYMIKPKGGYDYIDNYADDELQDKLFIPIDYHDMVITAASDPGTADSEEDSEEIPTEKSRKFNHYADDELQDKPFTPSYYQDTGIAAASDPGTADSQEMPTERSRKFNNYADDELQDKPFTPTYYQDMGITEASDSGTANSEEMPTERSRKFNNYADDELQDKHFVPFDYQNIGISPSSNSGTADSEDVTTDKLRKFKKNRHEHRQHRYAKRGRRNVMEPMHLKISVNPQVQLGNDSDIDMSSSIYMKNWFKGPKYRHMTFVSKDDIAFHVVGVQSNITRRPFMLDYSMSQKGINCDLKSPNISANLSQVQTIVDSFYSDTIAGNDAANFISSKGNDVIRGNGGNDAYKISRNCKDTIINNYDKHLDDDIIFIDQNYSSISLDMEPISESLEIYVADLGKAVTLQKWFEDETYRHAYIRTADGISGILPNVSDDFVADSKPIAVEISLEDEDCKYGSKHYDLSQEQYINVSRFTAKSDLCSYNITGNYLNNYLDPGPGNAFGYQYLEGGNGSDTYVIGANYGEFNEINNYAQDLLIDFVMLTVEYNYIETDIIAGTNDIVVRSNSQNNKVDVRIKNFLLGEEYQHIVLQSADKIAFRLLPHYRYRKPMIVDYSKSKFNQIIDASSLFPSASVIYGSSARKNQIYGSLSTKRLVGGSKNDTVEGGIDGEQIEGWSGNDILTGNRGNDIISGSYGDDTITGGDGNDVISGGPGADDIDGGDGLDSIIFVGDVINREGVMVSLVDGTGTSGDAEGDRYNSIEAVHGSNFTDVIEGSDDNNILSGNAGNDTLIAYQGNDVLVGGLDMDIYNLTQAEGWKIINNFASDNAMDTIVIDDNVKEAPCLYSYLDDVFVNIEKSNGKYLNLILKDWHKKETFQHITLEYNNKNGQSETYTFPNVTKYSTSIDQWVSFFYANADVKVFDYNSQRINVKIGGMIRYIPQDSFRLYVNYVSENQQYRRVRLNGRLENGSANFILGGNVLGGVMVSVSLSLHACNQVLAITSPITQRTLPNRPTNMTITHHSSVSFTVSWIVPTNLTDPNHHHYKYRCIAIDTMSRQRVNLITKRQATSCVFDRLERNTSYTLRVYSLIAGERSKKAAIIETQTLNLCVSLQEPTNGYIVDEVLMNSKEYATVRCNEGHELFALDTNDLSSRKIRSSLSGPDIARTVSRLRSQVNLQLQLVSQIQVSCNNTVPCATWNGTECLELVVCFSIECDKEVLSEYHLSVDGVDRNNYIHGEQIRVSCDIGYEFEDDEDSISLQCRRGKWHSRSGEKIPKCLKYSDCLTELMTNMRLSGDNTRQNPNGTITIDHGSTATVSCNEGYELSGPDQLRCRNGTITPSNTQPSCSPIPCSMLRSPSNGNAQLSPSGTPRHNSVYTFTCNSNYWRSGPGSVVCKSGMWVPSNRPTCRPKPCNTSPCINGGTCHNVNNYNYRCTCTREWHGNVCDRRTVHKDTLTTEVRAFVTRSGGACKPSELYTHLADNNNGRYPSYLWVVYCQFATGSRYWNYYGAQIIRVEYDDFDVWIGWQDWYSPPGIGSRLSRGESRAESHFSNAVLACNAPEMRNKVVQELGSLNLDYMWVMALRSSSYSYVGASRMVFSFERDVDCPRSGEDIAATVLSSFNLFGLIDNLINNRYSSTQRETMNIIVIGARERPGAAKRTSPARSLPFSYIVGGGDHNHYVITGYKNQRKERKSKKRHYKKDSL